MNVVEVVYRYDDKCSSATGGSCVHNITIPDKMTGQIYVYYQLSNYYQNHRRYVKSRSDEQLKGSIGNLGQCSPVETSANGSIIVPCGLIANSYFNDTFSATVYSGGVARDIGWSGKGIAWQSDIDNKFVYTPLPATLQPNGYPVYTNISVENAPLPKVTDEEFIVWMRTAGLPTFRKLHRKFSGPLYSGDIIQLNITDNYPVTSFGGQKAFVVSTTSWLGGKNDFLGWAYIAVSILCLTLAVIFLLKQTISPRRLGDMQYFHWSGASKPTEVNE